MNKNVITICTDFQLLDWTENGRLESAIFEILKDEHDNFQTEFRFGDTATICFPEKGGWKISFNGEYSDWCAIQVTGIVRYNKQRNTRTARQMSDLISEDIYRNMNQIEI